jgi:DNA-binding NtrC family response regulator
MDKYTRILVVDDDENISNAVKTILEREGYIVDLAATGKEAIKRTEETAYDLALLDIRLPDIEGVDLLKLMKDAVPRTRKIMVTGEHHYRNARAALNKNADAYLIKPIEIGKLLSTVKEQLELRETEKDLASKG